ncbi:MAG: hypothetical protein LQ352_001940 [Teloschistes flavicans]|nr:MAG: hypothetical protein LQ352_001940 [Teloschistes flavicans]
MARQHPSLIAVKTLQTLPRSILGKRKRINPSPERQEDDTTSQLTRPNLVAWGEQQESHRSTQNFPHPFEDMAYPTPSAETASSTGKSKPKSATSGLDAEAILDIYGIHLDREKVMPNDLQNLVQRLRTPRDIATTPNSKFVKDLKTANLGLQERTEMWALVEKLVYRPEWFPGANVGEPLIAVEWDQQWTAEVPKPAGVKDNTDLQNAMAKYGLPPRAQPDVTFGYNNETFTGAGSLLQRVHALPKDLLVYSGKPWFPYQTIQWKTKKGNEEKADQQTRRDAATSVNCLHEFFKYGSPAGVAEPSPAETCVFSLTVHKSHCRYRIHWRRVDDCGVVSYEGDDLRSAFFNNERQIFDVRSCILEVLAWTRESRLQAIQRKLQALGSPPPVPTAFKYGIRSWV